jgi:hypothetical protein
VNSGVSKKSGKMYHPASHHSNMFSLPTALLRIARDQTFWARYFWFKEDKFQYEELITNEIPYSEQQLVNNFDFHGIARPTPPTYSQCRVELPIAGGYGLALEFDPSFFRFELELLHLSGEVVQIGWDDQAHGHPHVLRWNELDTICRCMSLGNPELTHPGLTLLLLCRFAPITDSQQLALANELLQSAWRLFKIDGDELYRHLLKQLDCLENGFEWLQTEEQGWILHQNNA